MKYSRAIVDFQLFKEIIGTLVNQTAYGNEAVHVLTTCHSNQMAP